MTAGLILTAVAAHAVASSETLAAMVYGSGMVFWVLILAELALVMGISAGIGRISAGTASLLFIIYSILNEVTLSFVLMVYTGQSVFNAFLMTAGMFGVMSVYGLYTQRDLTWLRPGPRRGQTSRSLRRSRPRPSRPPSPSRRRAGRP